MFQRTTLWFIQVSVNERLCMVLLWNFTILLDGAFIYNPGHNILRHLDVWQNFRVTTSETNRDYN